MSLITWAAANWIQIAAGLGYVVAAARIIVKLTPTPADDSALASVITVLSHIGLQLPAASSDPAAPAA